MGTIITTKKVWMIAFGLGLLFGILSGLWLQSQTDLKLYLVTMQTKMKCAGSDNKTYCYEEEVPKLMDRGYSMDEAFVVTRKLLQIDEPYRHCHILAHLLTGKEVAKDVDNWKNVMVRAPFDICAGGGQHGAFMERYRVSALPDANIEDLATEFEGVCDSQENWSPSPYQTDTCRHALGHLAMYVTIGDTNKSLELCQALFEPGQNELGWQSCYHGVFMQTYQPISPEDYVLIEGSEVKSKSESEEFCLQYSGTKLLACTIERWPLFIEYLADPTEIDTICSIVNDGRQFDFCMDAMMITAFTIVANHDPAWATDFCPRRPNKYVGACFSKVATRIIEVEADQYEAAVGVCKTAEEYGVERDCYQNMAGYSTHFFTEDDERANKMCALMPEKYQSYCGY